MQLLLKHYKQHRDVQLRQRALHHSQAFIPRYKANDKERSERDYKRICYITGKIYDKIKYSDDTTNIQ